MLQYPTRPLRRGRDRRIGLLTVCVLAVGLGTRASTAHPSVSVVVDSTGTIYFSDLSRVWMIHPDGSRSVAVDNVHTHELWIGPDGNVWGDDVQNVGEQYRHRVWKRLPDGTLNNERPWRGGHPTEYYDFSFERDAHGLMYVLRSDDVSVEVHNESNVIRTIPLDQSLGFPHWLAVQPNGTVFVTIGSTLLRVGPGAAQAEVIATDLVDRRAAFADVHDRHAMMGTWIAPDGAVFVTDFVGQTVRRVEPGDTASATTAFWRAKDEWSATGGMTMRDGTVLLLEWSTRNDVRVRRIRTDGSSTVLGQG